MKETSLVVSLISILSFVIYPFQPALYQNDELKKSIVKGKPLYTSTCALCHMATGQGVEGVYPPLAQSDYLKADTKRAIKHIINGLEGEITVNGKVYDGVMPAQEQLTDVQIAHIINYVQNSWGNQGALVKPSDVQLIRKATSEASP